LKHEYSENTGLNPTSNQGYELNPIISLILIICLIFLLIFFSHPVFGLLFLIFAFLLYGISGVSLNAMVKRARFLVVFSIFIFLIQFLFTPGQDILFTLIPESSPIFPGALPISTNGILVGLSMTLRFLVIVFASFWFISITNPNKLAYTLMQLGLPYRYGFMIVTSLRFLPQFEVDSNIVRKAQLARGIKLDKGGIKNIYNHVKFTLRPLIITALQKADIVARSMEGRGFGYKNTRTYVDMTPITKRDVMITLTIISITSLLILTISIFYSQSELIEFLIS
jgi:energy-coupling factor transport system permease protein